MAAPTRPKLTPTTAKALRKRLRSPGAANLDPKATDAIIRSSPDVMLQRLNSNPLRLWDAAWHVDVWAVARRRVGEDDGGAYGLAAVMYEHAARHDPTGLILSAPRSWRWRDVHDLPPFVGPARPPAWEGLTNPTRHRPCGCYGCQWEQPHPRENAA